MSQMKKQPQRQCTGCRQMKDKRDLIRVIRTSDGQIQLDHTGRKNGRGAYICPDIHCLEKAIKTKGLERTLKTSIPEEIMNKLMEEIKEVESK